MFFTFLDVLEPVDKLTAEAKPCGQVPQPRLKSCKTKLKVKHLITAFNVIRWFEKTIFTYIYNLIELQILLPLNISCFTLF